MFTGDDFIRTMNAAVKKAQEASLKNGVPICYMELGGRIVQRWPNGRLTAVEPLPVNFNEDLTER
jgi:hypothetical protein